MYTGKAQDYLMRARYANIRIKALDEEVRRIRARLEGRASLVTGMPRGGGSDWTNLVMRICEIEREMEDVEAVKAEVHRVISAVEDERYRTVLMLKYLRGRLWRQIADEMYCDIRTATRWHGRALQRVEEILDGKA